jgi:hypothetical protein
MNIAVGVTMLDRRKEPSKVLRGNSLTTYCDHIGRGYSTTDGARVRAGRYMSWGLAGVITQENDNSAVYLGAGRNGCGVA